MCDRVLTLYRLCAYPGAVLRHASGATGPRSSESFFVDQILARMSVIIEASLRLGPTKLSFLGQLTRPLVYMMSYPGSSSREGVIFFEVGAERGS